MEVYSMVMVNPVVDRIYLGLLLLGAYILGYTLISDFILGFLRRSVEGGESDLMACLGVFW